MRDRTSNDALRLLRAINDAQTHGQEGARADPARAAHEAGLQVGSERYRGAMAYLLEEESDQHAHGYASYLFTERALERLEER